MTIAIYDRSWGKSRHAKFAYDFSLPARRHPNNTLPKFTAPSTPENTIQRIIGLRLSVSYIEIQLNFAAKLSDSVGPAHSVRNYRSMIGALTGDIVGSIYENHNIKTKEFPFFGDGCRFTDDTVCTIAIADCLLNDGDFARYLRAYVRQNPGRGYGGMFRNWASSPDMGPYNSWGNGSAMRVSPVPYFAANEAEIIELAERQSAVTHNHPDAVAGAQAVALAMWMAMSGTDPDTIRQEITNRFGYELGRSVDQIRPTHGFDISCAGTAPTAITCALEATGYEDAVRNAISLGGDSDTLACITGGIAEAMFGVPDEIAEETKTYLTDELNDVVDQFISAHSKRVVLRI